MSRAPERTDRRIALGLFLLAFALLFATEAAVGFVRDESVYFAAAEPAGDPVLVWRTAGHLGVQAEAAEPAVAAGLAEFIGQVRFCHPQARAAIYRAATPRELSSAGSPAAAHRARRR